MILQDEARNYLLQFLTGYEDQAVFRRFRIGYTADESLFPHYDLVFVPSGFFESAKYGKKESLPQGPLPRIAGVPFLFGENRVERAGDTVVVHADLPATAFFFLSRYEEICCRDVRDRHGRFPGKASLLYKNDLLFRPFLDEYAGLVRGWLREAGTDLPPLPKKISKLWLTHDVDEPFYCQTLRSFARETFRGKGLATAARLYFRKPWQDPYWSFPRLAAQDEACKAAAPFPVQSLYFFKGGGKSGFDKPVYRLGSRKIRKLIRFLDGQGAVFGLHGSYSSGGGKADPEEKKRLESALRRSVFFHRSHYLRSCEPEHFLALESMGITDDFSMGYADVSGFRLATSRPVIWIEPFTGRLTRLVLHPLAIMDNSLSEPDYMGLDPETARKYATMLFHAAQQHGGEICLLWHNTSVRENSYPEPPAPWLGDLYAFLLDYLTRMQGGEKA